MKQMTLIEMNGFLKGKCIPGNLKVNETNAEYLVRKFGELESKLETALRECRSAGITIDNLEEKCAALLDELDKWMQESSAWQAVAEKQLALATNAEQKISELEAAGIITKVWGWDMGEFTKEQLQEIVETDHVQCGDAAAMARQLLAGMEQDPVYFINKVVYADNYGDDVELKAYCSELDAMKSKSDFGGTVIPLYAAPQLPQPAAVSVPELVGWEDVPEEITEDDIALASAWAHGFNQCRAAMLQCSEPVTDNTNQQFESLSRGDK